MIYYMNVNELVVLANEETIKKFSGIAGFG